MGSLGTIEEDASMEEITTIGLELAKNKFQAHGSDSDGRVLLLRQWRRGRYRAGRRSSKRCRHPQEMMPATPAPRAAECANRLGSAPIQVPAQQYDVAFAGHHE